MHHIFAAWQPCKELAAVFYQRGRVADSDCTQLDLVLMVSNPTVALYSVAPFLQHNVPYYIGQILPLLSLEFGDSTSTGSGGLHLAVRCSATHELELFAS